MLKVLINRNPRNGAWGGGAHFVNAFYDYAAENSVQLVESISENPDVFFVFHPFSEDGGPSFNDAMTCKIARPNTKVIIRVNECDARKGTHIVDDLWLMMSKYVDHSIFVSGWMKEYFMKLGWVCSSNEVIINGIDHSRFEHQEKLSKSNGKVNIVCAHWSDNKFKGQDTYEFLDGFVSRNPEFTFTFIGRTKADLPNSKKIPALNPVDLAKELTKYDVCVNGTYWDPGPNAVMESITAGLPTFVQRNGGGATEFAGSDHVYSSMEELESLLTSRDYRPNAVEFEPWSKVMKRVFDRIKSL